MPPPPPPPPPLPGAAQTSRHQRSLFVRQRSQSVGRVNMIGHILCISGSLHIAAHSRRNYSN